MTEFSQATLLLVDDEAEVLDGLTKILTAAGYACHCASSEEAATRLAREIDADLLISDINLAGESGLTMCENLKRNCGLQSLPVMFLSGAQIPDIIRRAHAAGGTYYLRKPFDPEVLLELVDKALWMPHLAGPQLARA